VQLVLVHELADGGPHGSRLLARSPLADVEDDGRGRAEEARVPGDDAARPATASAAAGARAVVLELRDGSERVVNDSVLRRTHYRAHAHDPGEPGSDRVDDRGLSCVSWGGGTRESGGNGDGEGRTRRLWERSPPSSWPSFPSILGTARTDALREGWCHDRESDCQWGAGVGRGERSTIQERWTGDETDAPWGPSRRCIAGRSMR
jgi:hypothetical protein